MTDHITIPRALLEQALESLWQMTKKFSFERLYESRLSDSNVRVSAHDAMNAIRAELANPAASAWHDAPTCAGLWVRQYRNSFSTVVLSDYGIKKFDASEMVCWRWYGPIPQDKEGGEA